MLSAIGDSKMKSLICLSFVVACVSNAFTQDPSTYATPKEVSQLDWMLGNYGGSMKFTMPGASPIDTKCNIKAGKTLGGRFVQSAVSYDLMGMKAEGMQLLTYDPAIKKFRGWWFDSMTSEGMEMDGTLSDGTLVMVSKPMNIPGMGLATYRATWKKASEKVVAFTMESKDGDKWVVIIEGKFEKS